MRNRRYHPVALLLALALLLPAASLAEGTALPFGLQMGMSPQQVTAALEADATLGSLTPDTEDYGNGAVEYRYGGVTIPGTDLTADSLSVQVDRNNSLKADRLTEVGFVLSSPEHGIAAFRQVLAAMTATLGAPDADPFGEEAVSAYVEWGTLDASWTTADARVSLSLNRMYEENLTVQYSSRLNYDPADLAE
ncbi:MAG: hypothetical protein GX418_09565 [Clostridiales bacterium]|nr:hypothetical protein [Clostridiales bacterium]